MKTTVFSIRTMKEITRDPLSYIFCLGFPLIMLGLMTLLNESIPPQANMDSFQLHNLGPGIAVFGLTFVMLFTSLQVSKDRTTAFLTRLYATPMKAKNFMGGYTIPMVLIGLGQSAITLAATAILGIFQQNTFHPLHLFACMLVLLPSSFMYIAFGLFFGSLLNDKAAPGITSIIITASGMLGGIWMDVDAIGGTLKNICEVLPFYHGVKAAQLALSGQYDRLWLPLGITFLYALVIYIAAALIFQWKMRSDMK